MTTSDDGDRSSPGPDPQGSRSHARALTALALLAGMLATGCLPSGTRGEVPSPSGSGGAGSPSLSPSPAPTGPTPRPSFVPPTPTPEPTFLVYVVKTGDSLDTIAHRYRTTARSIAFWNRATYPSLDPESAHYRPDLLRIGWTLFLRPNDVVDEQELPEPSSSADAAADGQPADAVPSESATAD
jgi:hypothetical protein